MTGSKPFGVIVHSLFIIIVLYLKLKESHMEFPRDQFKVPYYLLSTVLIFHGPLRYYVQSYLQMTLRF